jgi:hypothetical protein
MSEPCKFEEKIIEMHGDIKTLVAEFKSMNGSLKDTKKGFDEHKKESEIHRYRITITWFVMQTVKWVIGGGIGVALLGCLFKR